jgi:hypothetical protein
MKRFRLPFISVSLLALSLSNYHDTSCGGPYRREAHVCGQRANHEHGTEAAKHDEPLLGKTCVLDMLRRPTGFFRSSASFLPKSNYSKF